MIQQKKITALIIAVLMVFGLFGYFSMSLEIIKPGYEGVVYNASGGIEDKTLSQGWKFISPLKSVTQYPISKEIFSYSKLADEGKEGDTSIPIISSEGKSVSINVTVVARANVKGLKQLYTDYRGKSFEEVIDLCMKPMLKSDLSKISSNYALFDINSSKRDEISNKVTESLQKKMIEENIIIESVKVTSVNLDEETKKTIDLLQKTVMESKQVIAVSNAAKVKAESEISVAEADTKKAKAQAEVVIATARGVANAAIEKAAGEAKANKMISDSLTPQLIEQQRIQANIIIQKAWASSWKGELPATFMSGANTSVMPYQMMGIAK